MPIHIYEDIPQTPGEEPRYCEVEQRMTDEPLTAHPETGVPPRRVFSDGFSVGTGGKTLVVVAAVAANPVRAAAGDGGGA